MKILIFLFLFFTSSQLVYACEDFSVPKSVNSGEEFKIQVKNVKSGYKYILSYEKDGLAQNVDLSSQIATSDSITFSKTLTVLGRYRFTLSGRPNDGRVDIDACGAKNDLYIVQNPNSTPAPGTLNQPGSSPVPSPWALSPVGCYQSQTGSFSTKKDCEEQARKQNISSPTPTPPALCDLDKKVCHTAFGDISTTPEGFIKAIFGILLSLAGGAALILIIISGYRLMTSQGNPEKVQAAREQLTSAIVGLLFIIFSLSILQIIGVDILQIPGLSR